MSLRLYIILVIDTSKRHKFRQKKTHIVTDRDILFNGLLGWFCVRCSVHRTKRVVRTQEA